MKQPGDQPLPTVNGGRDIQSMVMDDIAARRKVGVQRYGTALQAHNGRDSLRDLYEELLDGVMYVRQVMEEREHPIPSVELARLREELRHKNDLIAEMRRHLDRLSEHWEQCPENARNRRDRFVT